MKYLSFFFALILVSIFISSCGDDDSVITHADCVFVQDDAAMDGRIDDKERELMNDCRDNSFSSVSEIESNLIGEWKLIGFGHGWFHKTTQPCSFITITSNELIFEYKNSSIDTLTTHTWEIQESSTPGLGSNFSLKINNDNVQGLSINQFCEDFMYGDWTPVDGNMYLYQKVN